MIGREHHALRMENPGSEGLHPVHDEPHRRVRAQEKVHLDPDEGPFPLGPGRLSGQYLFGQCRRAFHEDSFYLSSGPSVLEITALTRSQN